MAFTTHKATFKKDGYENTKMLPFYELKKT